MKFFGIVFMALLASVAFASESLDSTAQRMLKGSKSLSMSMGMKSMKSSKSASKKSSKSSKSTAALTTLFSFTISKIPGVSDADLEASVLSIFASLLSDRRRLQESPCDVLDDYFEAGWDLDIQKTGCQTNPEEKCLLVTFTSYEQKPLEAEVVLALMVELGAVFEPDGYECSSEGDEIVCSLTTQDPTFTPTFTPTFDPTFNTTNTTITRFLENGGYFLDWDDREEEEEQRIE